MERPEPNYEQPQDEYDHELTRVQAGAIALADELLKHKPEKSPITFVDMILVGDQHEMLAELETGPMSGLLAKPDEQLAIESDGSYYPILDVRKQNGRFTGMGLRVWGWDYDKIRYIKEREQGPPYEFKEYPEEKDKARQIDIRMGYVVGEESVVEEVTIYASTTQRDYIHASRSLSMMAYAETGYEGHGRKSDDEMSDEALEWFLDFVARHVGDDPKSHYDIINEQVEKMRELARSAKALTAFNALVKASWDAQALSLVKRRCYLLEGKTIAQGLNDPELAPKAADALRRLAKQYKTYSKNGKLEECENWVVQLGYTPEGDE